MNIPNHKVAVLTGGLVCLLLTGCQKEELATPTGVAMANSMSLTNGDPTLDGDPSSIPVQPPGVLNGRWSLYSMHGRIFHAAASETPWLAISLGPDSGGEGALRGFGGCNRISGTVDQAGATLSMTDLGRTRKYCAAIHATEEAFFNVLSATDHFEEVGYQLRLLAGNSELAILYRVDRVPPEVAAQ